MIVYWTFPGRGITNFPDLKGKKVIYLETGGYLSEEYTNLILSAYGMSQKDVTSLRWTTKAQQMQSVDTGESDAGLIATSAYNLPPEFQEQESKKPIQWINIPQDKMEAVVAAGNGRYRISTFPGGLFKNYPKDFPILNFDSAIVCIPSIPESVVYGLAKNIWDSHNDEFLASWGANKVITLQNTIKSIGLVPAHPGLIKYIKEKGLWTNDLEARQQKALSDLGSSGKK